MKNIYNGVIATTGTFVTYALGGWDSALKVLALFIAIDYITGMMKAIYKKELDSSTGYIGILRKAGILIVIIVAHQMDKIVLNDAPIFRTMACWFYTGNEGISILENLALLGIPLPNGIGEALKKMKETT